MKLSKQTYRLIAEIVIIILANALYAASVALFVVPAGLITCGTTGIALFVNRLTGFPIAWFTDIFYGAMFVIGFIFLGRKFALTTLVSTVSYPLFYSIFEPLLQNVQLTDNPLLATIYAGGCIGLSVGLVIRCGASTGGTDIPPLLANKYCRVPVAVGIWTFDVIILFLQAILATSEQILYGLLLVVIYSVLIDKVLLLGQKKLQVTVVTNKPGEITSAIFAEIGRGVTLLHGKTGYLKRECDLVMTVITARQLYRIQALLRRIDPAAFTIVHSVADVHGYGFTTDVPFDPDVPESEVLPEETNAVKEPSEPPVQTGE